MSNHTQTLLCLTALLALLPLARGSTTPDQTAEDDLACEVTVQNGVPVFLVNGEERVLDLVYHTLGSTPAMRYTFPNVLGKDANPSEELIKLGREYGFDFYTMPMPLVWPKDGVEPDYSIIDGMIDEHIRLHPGARIVPRIRGEVPKWWIEQNPDARMEYLSSVDLGTLSANAQRELHSYASPASEKWLRAYTEAIRLQVEHLEAKYGNHMLAYNPGSLSAHENFFPLSWNRNHIVMAGADENFRQGFIHYARDKYQTIDALNQAWNTSLADFDEIQLPTLEERIEGDLGTFRDPQTQQYVIDFSRYFQKPIANYLIEVGRTIKEASGYRKPVIIFYSGPDSGHSPLNAVQRGNLAMEEILASPYIDIITNPYSYNNRQHGGAGSVGNVLDSINAHGKLYIVEDDTRSHNFPYKHFSKTANLQESLDVFLRLLPHTMQHNTGRWYLCFGSGANAEKPIFERFEEMRLLRETIAPVPFHPEIAMVLDTDSYYYLRGSNEVSLPTMAMFKHESAPHIGAPYSRFLLSDVIEGKIPDETKVLFFLNTYAIDNEQREKLHQLLAQGGRTAVWFYAPGFIANNHAASQNITQLTGIELNDEPRAGKPQFQMVEAFHGVPAGHTFGSDTELSTLFTIVPDQEHVNYLARYTDGEGYGLAFREMNGWTSVLFTGVSMDPDLFRALSQEAGAHIYSHSGDSIVGSSNFVAITALSEGNKELVFPSAFDLTDLVTGELVAQDVTEISIPMRLGETRIFLTAPAR